jgi:hypothetical protein
MQYCRFENQVVVQFPSHAREAENGRTRHLQAAYVHRRQRRQLLAPARPVHAAAVMLAPATRRSKVAAGVVMAVVVGGVGFAIWWLTTTIAPHAIAYRDVVERAHFGVIEPSLVIKNPKAIIQTLEAFGCEFYVKATKATHVEHKRGKRTSIPDGREVRVRARGVGSVPVITARFLKLTNLDIKDVKGAGLTVTQDRPIQPGRGLTIEFESAVPTHLYAYADAVRIPLDASLELVNADVSGDVAALDVKGDLSGGNAYFNCGPLQDTREARVRLVVPENATGAFTLFERMQVTDLRLTEPEGAVNIGDSLVQAALAVTGAARVEFPGETQLRSAKLKAGEGEGVEVAVAAQSSNVRLDERQIVPTYLDEIAKQTSWSALAAVAVLVLSQLIGKLFDVMFS